MSYPARIVSKYSDQNQVYIVTGSNSGVGKEVARILYSKHAKVYVAARSESKAQQAIASIQKAHPSSTGSLVYLHLDLADLSTIKASATDFLSKESQLHVLFNNAGIMQPPQGSKTPQGYELQIGTNNLGPFLFTKFLTPLLIATAKAAPKSTVRVVWAASNGAEWTPKNGVPLDNLDYHKDMSAIDKYSISKAGNYFQGTEFARRCETDGVVSIPLNPGNLKTNLYHEMGSVVKKIMEWIMLYDPIYGAYTELFAGLSPECSIEKTGTWGKCFQNV